MESSTVQKQIQQDWENREFTEVVSEGIKKIAEFLNDFVKRKLVINDDEAIKVFTEGDGTEIDVETFALDPGQTFVCAQEHETWLHGFMLNDISCRSRLAKLSEKLTSLEQQIEFIEGRVTKGETLS